MKIVATIARILLALVFLVFGLNGFLHFIPNPPMPPGLVGEFIDVFTKSHWAEVVSFFQVAGSLLLLAGRYVPLGLAILGPIIFNILVFHILLSPSGIGIGVVTLILWLIVFFHVRKAFTGLFLQRVPD